MQRLQTVFSFVACVAPTEGYSCCLQGKRNSFLLIRHSTGRSMRSLEQASAALRCLRYVRQVMQYCEGGDLSVYLKNLKGRRLSERVPPSWSTHSRVPSVTAYLSIYRPKLNSCPARIRSARTVLANRRVS